MDELMSMPLTKCIVFGGHGFMGSALRSHLQRLGRYAVFAPTHSELDLCDASAVLQYISTKQPEIVVNLAALSVVLNDDDRTYYKVNTFGHLNVLRALAAQPGQSRLLLASSAQVYGHQSRAPALETSEPAPVNHYGLAKLLAESLMEYPPSNVTAVAARPFNCIGRHQPGHFLIPKIIRHFRERAPQLTIGADVERDFIDIRDVCNMWSLVIEAKSPFPLFNFSNCEAIPLSHIIDMLVEMTKHRIEVVSSKELMRPNDLLYQCGDNTRIKALGYSRKYSLMQTLRWMLQNE